MNKTIHDFIRRFTHSREWCHEEMQKRDLVGPDGCPGLVGGDHETDFLQYECIGCPYIDPKAYCTHPASSKQRRITMLKDLKKWTEVTRGLYRYVIAAKCCYELHILHWDHDTDILTAKASVYLVGDWHQRNGNSFFEREPILLEKPVFECLEAAYKDDKENNNA